MTQILVLKMKLPENFQKNISASYTLLGSILGFGGLGYWLSIKYNNKFLFITLLLIGMIVGMSELYKQMKK